MLIDLDELLHEIDTKSLSLLEAEKTTVKTPQGKAAIWGAMTALLSIVEWACKDLEEGENRSVN